jgi:hypothetical protein
VQRFLAISCGTPLVAFDFAITQKHSPWCASRDFEVVRNQDDCSALFVELFQQIDYRGAGFRVERSGWLIGQNDVWSGY